MSTYRSFLFVFSKGFGTVKANRAFRTVSMGSFSAYRFMGFRAVAVLLLSFSERSKVSVLNPLFGPKSRFRSQISVPRSRTVRFVFRTVEVRRKEIKRKEAKRERRFQHQRFRTVKSKQSGRSGGLFSVPKACR